MATATLSGGRKTVTSAGTAERLTATDSPCLWVRVYALTSNTTQVNVGGANTIAAAGATESGAPLLGSARDDILLDVNNLTDVWVDARTSGEGVTYVYGR